MIDKNSSKKQFVYNNTIKVKQNPLKNSDSEAKENKKQQKHSQPIKSKLLLENKSLVNNSYLSHKNSIEENVLHKLKKNGILSQQPSKQGTPRQQIEHHDININKHARKSSEKQKLMIFQQQSFSFATSSHPQLHKNLFAYKYVIGRGGFGKVWKVELKKNKKSYAMKEMSKALIITKKSVPSVMNERKLLQSLKHPFIVNMITCFQDRQTLYLVMDLMPGGDLRYHIGSRRRFNQQQTKFFIACIFLGLEYLHSNNIIHRDIKPENLVFDQKGYLRITDLGIARYMKPENSADTSGTPGYMAPQVICRQNHSFGVDYFALGVIAYEFMIGKRPYLGRSRNEIRQEILARQVQVKKHEISDGWSLQAADFVNRLIQRKPTNRLGFTGPQEIRNHPWLRQFPWEKLINKELVAPYKPDIEVDNFDEKQISSQNEQIKELLMQNVVMLRKQQVQNLFQGYQSSAPINLIF